MGGAACAAYMLCEMTPRHLQLVLGSPTVVHFDSFDQLTEQNHVLSVGQISLVSGRGSLCSLYVV